MGAKKFYQLFIKDESSSNTSSNSSHHLNEFIYGIRDADYDYNEEAFRHFEIIEKFQKLDYNDNFKILKRHSLENYVYDAVNILLLINHLILESGSEPAKMLGELTKNSKNDEKEFYEKIFNFFNQKYRNIDDKLIEYLKENEDIIVFIAKFIYSKVPEAEKVKFIKAFDIENEDKIFEKTIAITYKSLNTEFTFEYPRVLLYLKGKDLMTVWNYVLKKILNKLENSEKSIFKVEINLDTFDKFDAVNYYNYLKDISNESKNQEEISKFLKKIKDDGLHTDDNTKVVEEKTVDLMLSNLIEINPEEIEKFKDEDINQYCLISKFVEKDSENIEKTLLKYYDKLVKIDYVKAELESKGISLINSINLDISNLKNLEENIKPKMDSNNFIEYLIQNYDTIKKNNVKLFKENKVNCEKKLKNVDPKKLCEFSKFLKDKLLEKKESFHRKKNGILEKNKELLDYLYVFNQKFKLTNLSLKEIIDIYSKTDYLIDEQLFDIIDKINENKN
jgi:hypothetical protein